MVFCSVQSAPFVSEGDRRGDGTFDDYRRLVRLTHMIDELDTAGYPICEAGDLPIDSRHLQMLLCLYTDSDKPLGTAQFNPVGAATRSPWPSSRSAARRSSASRTCSASPTPTRRCASTSA